jgi:hypothetical protein
MILHSTLSVVYYYHFLKREKNFKKLGEVLRLFICPTNADKLY